jgi:hypothetical protein
MMMDHDLDTLLKSAASVSTRELLLAAKEEEAPRAVRDRVLATLAETFERASADRVRVSLSTASGVFEKNRAEHTELHSVGSLARAAAPAARDAGGPANAWQAGVPTTTWQASTWQASAWQLVAAVVVGVLGAKAAHLTTEALASRSDGTSAPVASARAIAPVGLTRPPAASMAPSEPVHAARALVEPSISAHLGRACAVNCVPHEPRNLAARAALRSKLEELEADPPDQPDEDWLGEQLALLSRAERSLTKGNLDGALRSIGQYEARFPKGLLDLQIAALRERAQQPAETFIFP